jgi:SAM-dependent methyltransferase
MGYTQGYDAIAAVYDRLNAEIDYGAWADFVEENFKRYLEKKPSLVLDLACGTGRMTVALADRGYDMIGVDGSAEMLNIAMSRAREAGQGEILYLLQDMRAFELYGTVGAVTCCLDSVNYLTEEGDLRACFATVHNYLDPDGLFFFDVNTPYKFETVYGENSYLFDEETEDGRLVYCGWQNYYDPQTHLCDFDLSVFTEDADGRYRREDESHTERCYTLSELTETLRETGFELIAVHGDLDGSAPTQDCERWYVVARAKKD